MEREKTGERREGGNEGKVEEREWRKKEELIYSVMSPAQDENNYIK